MRAAVMRVGAVEDLRPEGADHLHAVAHGDGEDQERHQDRHRVDAEAEQVDHAELPDDGQGRARQDEERQPVRLRVEVDEPAGQEEAAEEEQHDPLGPGGHVAHHLGEPDDVHVHGRARHDSRRRTSPARASRSPSPRRGNRAAAPSSDRTPSAPR